MTRETAITAAASIMAPGDSVDRLIEAATAIEAYLLAGPDPDNPIEILGPRPPEARKRDIERIREAEKATGPTVVDPPAGGAVRR